MAADHNLCCNDWPCLFKSLDSHHLSFYGVLSKLLRCIIQILVLPHPLTFGYTKEYLDFWHLIIPYYIYHHVVRELLSSCHPSRTLSIAVTNANFNLHPEPTLLTRSTVAPVHKALYISPMPIAIPCSNFMQRTTDTAPFLLAIHMTRLVQKLQHAKCSNGSRSGGLWRMPNLPTIPSSGVLVYPQFEIKLPLLAYRRRRSGELDLGWYLIEETAHSGHG